LVRRAPGFLHGRLARAWRTAVFQRTALISWLAWPVAYPAAWLWRRTWLRHARLIAVTGSVGKTSTAAAVAAAAGAAFDPDGANYGSFLAARLLRHRPRRACLVVEVGISRPRQMCGYARLLRPDVVVLTAIGSDHLHAFGSREALARDKALLAQAVGRRGLVVVNGDDELCNAIAARLAAHTVRVGFAADCDWRIEQAAVDWPHGTQLRLAGPTGTLPDGPPANPGGFPAVSLPGGPVGSQASNPEGNPASNPPGTSASGSPSPSACCPTGGTPGNPAGCPATGLAIHTRWLGRDLARCVAFAAAAAIESGTGGAAAAVVARLEALPPTPGRLEPLPLPGGAWLLCDAWKSSWEPIQSALRELAGLAGRRRVAVLGDVEEPQGSQGAAYRRYGLLAAAAAHRIVFIGTSTDFRRFRAGVRQAAPAMPEIQHCADVQEAAAALRSELTPGTVILIKGRHSQKLHRVAILLRGGAVACRLQRCPARGLRCELCPRLGGAHPAPRPAVSRRGLKG
jgi:UDP-N-acetylmuramyl pentapeptide synthase